MARVQNTLIGRSSGSVGGTTFTTWKGINVLKAKAVTVANPQTLPQRQQRSRLAFMVNIYRTIAASLVIGFRSLAIEKSPYNAFMSTNIIAATSVDASAVTTLVPANFQISKGTIGAVAQSGGSPSATNGSPTVQISWSTTLPLGGADNDLINMAVYNETQDNWGINIGTDVRVAGTSTVTMPTNVVNGDTLHSYFACSSQSDNSVSDTSYATVTI